MNERIEEFAKDCKILGEKEFAGKVVGFNYKKFAELIVRECVDRIKNADMTDLEGPDPDDVLWLVERQIVEHFGVEE